MPTEEYTKVLYPKFGVSNFHSNNVFGQNVSIYIIDTGLTNTVDLLHVKNRSVENPMAPKNTHGSFVASIVAARPKNGHSGIAPEAQVYLCDVSSKDGVIYTSALVKAIKDATDLRVDIISISLGTNTHDVDLERAVREASKLGILVFAASGNCSCRAYEYPSSCESAISVASVDLNHKLSPFNTKNDTISIFAPGQNIKVPGASSRLSGTSFAVPFASALAALELSRRRLHDPKATMNREDAIGTLRDILGLDCAMHTYTTSVCSRPVVAAFRPKTNDGLTWLVILCAFSGLLVLYSMCITRVYLKKYSIV